MHSYLNHDLATLAPYVPGEQPQSGGWVKLNTNESPYPPSPLVAQAVAKEAERLQLYSDPSCAPVIKPLANLFGLQENQVFVSNGSDEVLAFLFQGFCPNGAAFADLTYGFYPVYAKLYGIETKIVPLRENFVLAAEDYKQLNKTIFIANPNAPTGIALPLAKIEQIIQENENSLVVIDEAYVHFGAQTAIPLLAKYDNLVVVGTFSKSRSLAGARLGYAAASAGLIADLNRIKFSFNPYNVNRMTLAAGAASIADAAYFNACCKKIIDVRAHTISRLTGLGFECTNSLANFVFVKHNHCKGNQLYSGLQKNKVLVRRFNLPRINNHLRITIGNEEEMEKLVVAIESVLKALI